jgi:hypothetical protein
MLLDRRLCGLEEAFATNGALDGTVQEVDLVTQLLLYTHILYNITAECIPHMPCDSTSLALTIP